MYTCTAYAWYICRPMYVWVYVYTCMWYLCVYETGVCTRMYVIVCRTYVRSIRSHVGIYVCMYLIYYVYIIWIMLVILITLKIVKIKKYRYPVLTMLYPTDLLNYRPTYDTNLITLAYIVIKCYYDVFIT